MWPNGMKMWHVKRGKRTQNINMTVQMWQKCDKSVAKKDKMWHKKSLNKKKMWHWLYINVTSFLVRMRHFFGPNETRLTDTWQGALNNINKLNKIDITVLNGNWTGIKQELNKYGPSFQGGTNTPVWTRIYNYNSN